MSKSPATITEFRAWAAESGITVGARGRVSAEAVKAFTKATGRKVVTPVPTTQVRYSFTDARGRKQTRTTSLPNTEVRALLGHPEGRRGKFSAADLVAAGEAFAAQRA